MSTIDIVTEDYLRQLFNDLPDIVDVDGNNFKPKFSWGDGIQFNKFIQLSYDDNNWNTYPLIWYDNTSINETHGRQDLTRRLKLIICTTVMPNIDYLNEAYWDNQFKTIIDPLTKSVVDALRRSNRTNIIEIGSRRDNFDLKRRAKYSVNDQSEENKTVDVIAASVLEITVRFINKCYKPIPYG